MTMTTSTIQKNLANLTAGTSILGKWYKHQYRVMKKLGEGANGIVYLVEHQHKKYALKISIQSLSITSEVNVLKHFKALKRQSLGPKLIEVDDWKFMNHQCSFYVMEYIEGVNLLTFIQQKGHAWVNVLVLQLLDDLHALHQSGWVFGDLKPENIIVSESPYRIRCIDVGGTTKEGRAIKEFTEFFDRGYWQAGSRKADARYDLFAVAMIIVNLFYPKRFSKSEQPIKSLYDKIDKHPRLKQYKKVLIPSIQGKFHNAETMKQQMLQLVKTRPTVQAKSKATSVQTRQQMNHRKLKNQTSFSFVRFLQTIGIIGAFSFCYILYIYRYM